MQLTPADGYPLPELARRWARAYSEYFVPVSDDPDQLARHLALNDVDLARSLVACGPGGEFVGLALLAVRGDRGWIGGFGIAPEFRRRGLAAPLLAAQLDLARTTGVRSVQLEVLEQNRARKVYDAAGFTTRRRLLGLRGALPPPTASAPPSEIDRDRVRAALARSHASVRPAWQREAATVRHALARGARGFVAPDGNAAAVLGAEGARVLDAAGEPESALALLAAATHGEAFTLPNEPEGSPLARALRDRGFEQVWAQQEMFWPD